MREGVERKQRAKKIKFNLKSIIKCKNLHRIRNARKKDLVPGRTAAQYSKEAGDQFVISNKIKVSQNKYLLVSPKAFPDTHCAC